MDKVDGCAGLAGQQQRAADWLHFRERRPGAGPGARIALAGRLRLCSEGSGEAVALGVQPDDHSQLGPAPERAVEGSVVHAGIAVQARVAHERLRSDHPAGVQLPQLPQIGGHDAAPQTVVHDGPVGDGRRLEGQAGAVQGGRIVVERHVQEGGDPAGGGRGAAGGVPLPVGAARLVEMDVAVDQAGQQQPAAGVDASLGLNASRAWLQDGRHAPVADGQVSPQQLVLGDEGSTSDQQVSLHHASSQARPRVPGAGRARATGSYGRGARAGKCGQSDGSPARWCTVNGSRAHCRHRVGGSSPSFPSVRADCDPGEECRTRREATYVAPPRGPRSVHQAVHA